MTPEIPEITGYVSKPTPTCPNRSILEKEANKPEPVARKYEKSSKI
jgi:hypothetical protein